MVESRAIEVSTALLAAISDPIRWQLVSQLGEKRCVCELTTEPAIPGNLLSYHLKVLREAGLIVGTRRGRWVDYELAPGALDRLHAALPVPVAEVSCGCVREPVGAPA